MQQTLKKKLYIIVGSLSLLILAAIFLLRDTATPATRDLDQIIQSGTIYVVSEQNDTGFYVTPDSVSGFQYEILKRFAEKLSVEIEIATENDLKSCIDKLNKGKYDIITRYIPTTTEWQQKIAFSSPLIISRQMLVQLTDSFGQPPVRTLRELEQDTIYIPSNSPNKMRLNHLAEESAIDFSVLEMDNQTQQSMVTMVSEGKIKNTICYEQLAVKLSMEYGNIDISLPLSLPQPYGWAVNKESTKLLNELNSFLTDFIGSMDYWNLYQKYY